MIEGVHIRPITLADNPQLAHIIRTVMPEFGASGKGFAIHDTEVNDMYAAYTRPRCAYWVCELMGQVIGGGGVAPLEHGDDDTCELKKMYFLPDGRGRGLGQEVLRACLASATQLGFAFCYLETFHTMTQAMTLYERNGFEKIPGPCGNTGHFACDVFYRKKLR
jgi:putative acetyltransferase